jgi:hypothetical protein
VPIGFAKLTDLVTDGAIGLGNLSGQMDARAPQRHLKATEQIVPSCSE